MRILLLGAAGFIGRHILAELLEHGHDVTAVVRASGGLPDAFPQVRFISLDLAKAIRPQDWEPHLAGVDTVVNAAGVLRGATMDAIHVEMPRALHAAAAHAGVSRVVLLSAISARIDVPTDYARAKLAGEEALRSSGLGWTILRPSLVYGDGSYGGTSLLRGLAALPWRVPLPGGGDFTFTPLHARDLARAVRLVCEDERLANLAMEPVGPETLDLKALLARYRQWLGFGCARFVPVPLPVMRILGRIGDLTGKGPVSTNSLVQMIAGNAGDSSTFAQQIGFTPRAIEAAFAARPSQVQDRWHSRLFFLAPAVLAALALTWIASAILGLAHGAARTNELVSAIGLPLSWATPLRVGGSVLDLAIAAVLLVAVRTRFVTLVQLAVVAGYTVVIGIGLPSIWLDPLGPLLKNLPFIALILVHGVIGDRR